MKITTNSQFVSYCWCEWLDPRGSHSQRLTVIKTNCLVYLESKGFVFSSQLFTSEVRENMPGALQVHQLQRVSESRQPPGDLALVLETKAHLPGVHGSPGTKDIMLTFLHLLPSKD